MVVYLLLSNSDTARIRQVVDRFAIAVDADDQTTILAVLCTEEATTITEDDDYIPADGEEPATAAPPGGSPVTTSDVQVRGDVAAAAVARAGRTPVTLYLQKENGSWTICAPAETRFATSGG